MKKLFVALLYVAVIGCGTKPLVTSIKMDGPPPELDDAHDHPAKGPHQGTLVDLGNEEFHAEVVHNAEQVTVYVLDSSATKAVSIDAKDLVINLIHEGQPEQFKLSASPELSDETGKSSRFIVAGAELVEHLDDESAAVKLMVTINGTAYRGEIKHDHEHDHSGHVH